MNRSWKEQILLGGTQQPQEGRDIEFHRESSLKGIWRRLRRNKLAMTGLVILLVMILLAILAPVIASEGYDAQVLGDKLLAPSWEHPFGTDNLGRDILSRCIWGGRYSITVGFISVIMACIGGVILGMLAGFYGGRTDNIIMRALDVFMAIPPILLAIAIASALGAGFINLMMAVGLGTIPAYARIIRASVMSIRDQEFVEAARCSGANNFRIMFRYVFPNCLSPLIVQITIGVASAILVASSMSFIGLGLQPPIPEWGAMLSDGRPYIRQAWWVCTFPGIMIMLSVFSLNVFGDGLRDALDPKLKR